MVVFECINVSIFCTNRTKHWITWKTVSDVWTRVPETMLSDTHSCSCYSKDRYGWVDTAQSPMCPLCCTVRNVTADPLKASVPTSRDMIKHYKLPSATLIMVNGCRRTNSLHHFKHSNTKHNADERLGQKKAP